MEKPVVDKKNRLLKTLVFILGFLSVCLIGYLIFLPLYPIFKYRLSLTSFEYKPSVDKILESKEDRNLRYLEELGMTAEEVAESPNRVIIKKIGVDAPIVEGAENESKKALSKGAWRIPEASTPEKGSNTVISAHRYKYLPPNNLTFYLLDKLVAGDIVNVIWEGKLYNYKMTESKIVPPTEISILDPTAKPILTLFTCDPIWSEENRLVVIAELIEQPAPAKYELLP